MAWGGPDANGGDPNKDDSPNFGTGWRSRDTEQISKDTQSNKIDYQLFIKQMGLPMSPFWESFVDAAVRQKWTPSEFKSRLIDSNHFDKMFPGIKRPDGSLRMDPSSYRAMEDTYKETARTQGISIGNIHTGKLIENNVSPQEFSDRMQAVDRMRDYGPFMENFIQQAGGGSSQFAGKKGMFDFVLGLAPRKFYQAWEKASLQTGAERAGVNWLKDGQIKKWAGFTEGNMTEEEYHAKFVEVAQNKAKGMPLSQLHGFGVTKNDLVELSFGGPRAAQVAMKLERGMKTQEATSRGMGRGEVDIQAAGTYENPGVQTN